MCAYRDQKYCSNNQQRFLHERLLFSLTRSPVSIFVFPGPIITVPSLKRVIRYYKKSNQKNRIIEAKDIHSHHQFLLNL
jgi:hypothetical protein